MTIYAKCLLATTSAILFVSTPSNQEEQKEPQRSSYNVDRLIGITEQDIRHLECRIDSILIERSDSLVIKSINNGAAITQ